jgi:hypothetical protein
MRRFLAALLILILAFILQFALRGSLGFYSNLTLSALIAFSLSLNLPELIFLILAAVFVLNAEPAFSWDTLVFALLPVISFCLRRFFKWKPWVTCMAMIFSAFLAMYLILAPAFLWNAPALFLGDLAAGLAFGVVALYTLRKYARDY